MFQSLIFWSGFLGVITGFVVLAFGNWEKFILKYSGVALSTAAASYLMWMSTFHSHAWICHDGDFYCDAQMLSFLMRNLAFVCFHVSCGRDAIRFKKCDRRFCPKGKGDRRLNEEKRSAA